jgi:hypothetical protein
MTGCGIFSMFNRIAKEFDFIATGFLLPKTEKPAASLMKSSFNTSNNTSKAYYSQVDSCLKHIEFFRTWLICYRIPTASGI